MICIFLYIRTTNSLLSQIILNFLKK